MTRILFYLPTPQLISIPPPGAVYLRLHFLWFGKLKPAGVHAAKEAKGVPPPPRLACGRGKPSLRSNQRLNGDIPRITPCPDYRVGLKLAAPSITALNHTKTHQPSSPNAPNIQTNPQIEVPLASQNASSRAPTDRAPGSRKTPAGRNLTGKCVIMTVGGGGADSEVHGGRNGRIYLWGRLRGVQPVKRPTEFPLERRAAPGGSHFQTDPLD